MPELPEVEVTRRGIAPHVEGEVLRGMVVRNRQLRWPVPAELPERCTNFRVSQTGRRGKYLLLQFDNGTQIIHLGMSGSLRIVEASEPPGLHDHIDWVFDAIVLRLRDPRRFGAVLWHDASAGPVLQHPRLASLGVEPLESGFDGRYLYAATRGRTASIKHVLLAGDVVVGVGNIYASESLFRARIHPLTPASRLSAARADRLAEAIRSTLLDAIAAGGSSLRDFIGSDGTAGYFQVRCNVYGRDGQPCLVCGSPVRRLVQGQRATFYCVHCQKY